MTNLFGLRERAHGAPPPNTTGSPDIPSGGVSEPKRQWLICPGRGPYRLTRHLIVRSHSNSTRTHTFFFTHVTSSCVIKSRRRRRRVCVTLKWPPRQHRFDMHTVRTILFWSLAATVSTKYYYCYYYFCFLSFFVQFNFNRTDALLLFKVFGIFILWLIADAADLLKSLVDQSNAMYARIY